MFAALVRVVLRRPVEATGVIMGEFEIINLESGKYTRSKRTDQSFEMKSFHRQSSGAIKANTLRPS